MVHGNTTSGRVGSSTVQLISAPHKDQRIFGAVGLHSGLLIESLLPLHSHGRMLGINRGYVTRIIPLAG